MHIFVFVFAPVFVFVLGYPGWIMSRARTQIIDEKILLTFDFHFFIPLFVSSSICICDCVCMYLYLCLCSYALGG